MTVHEPDTAVLDRTERILSRAERTPVRADWTRMDRFYREALEDGKAPSLSVPHEPTDWSAESDEILEGWNEEWGTCPDCFILKSKSGRCNCS